MVDALVRLSIVAILVTIISNASRRQLLRQQTTLILGLDASRGEAALDVFVEAISHRLHISA